MAGEFPDHALAEPPNDLVFLQGSKAHQHRHAEAKQGDETVLAGFESDGSRRQEIAALEARHVNTVSQQHRAGGHARAVGQRRRRGDVGHEEA
jgi:hypothetical protein